MNSRMVCVWSLLLCTGLYAVEKEPEPPKMTGVLVNGEKILPASIEILYQRKLNTYKRMVKGAPPTQEVLQQLSVEARQQAVQKALIRQYAESNKLVATPAAIQEEELFLREQISAAGMSFDDYLKDCNQSLEDFRRELSFLAALTQSCTEVFEQDKLQVEFERVKKNIPTRRASHILFMHVKVPETTQKVRTKEDAKRLADETLAAIRGGADFAELAREKSDCASKDKGGDLDWFVFEKMAKPFSVAAFGLEKVGDVSAVVESNFGYHIIKLTGLRNEDDCFKYFVRNTTETKLREILTKLAREAKVVPLP